MLRKKIGINNYFVVVLILLGITALMVFLTFILTAVFPNSLGRSPFNYEIGTVCEFEPWSFEANNLKVNFPQGGIIIAVNESETKRSVILLGEGFYEQDGLIRDSLETGGLFMFLEHALFEELRGNNIFMPIEDEELLGQVETIFARQVGMPAVWEKTIPITFHTTEGLIYYYFLSAEGEPILPPEYNGSFTQFFGSLLIYILIILIIILIITIFSPDHRYSRYWDHLGKTDPGTFSKSLIPLLVLLILIAEIVTNIGGWHRYLTASGYIAAIVVLILSSKYGKIDYLDFGLRRDRVNHGYILSVIAAIIMIGITRGLPVGASSDLPAAVISLPLIFLIIALPQEMIWRGYIQAILSRRLDPTKGLFAMIFLAAIAQFIFIAITSPWLIFYPYTYLEVIVLVPGTAAILGYIYLRTENILSCALMHSLILWLPGIILF